MNQYDLLKEGTTDYNQALSVWGKGNIIAGVKCSYAELYTADGTKIFSLQKSASVNTGHKLLIPTGRTLGHLIEVKLTKECYKYLTDIMKIHNNYTDGKYASIIPYLYIDSPDGWQKSYKAVSFYVSPSALRYFGKQNATNDEQGTIISNYEVDEHNQQVQDEINKKREELERKKKQVLLLGLAAGAVSLFALN